MQLDFNQLRELLTSLADTDITELELKGDDFHLNVRRGSEKEVVMVPAAPAMAPMALPTQPVIAAAPAPTPAPAAPSAPPAAAPGGDKLVEICSPMVGTFYRSPAPDEPPFVSVGDRVSPGQTVCILEAMKLMNELEAEVSGEIVDILVQNGEPVEFNQPLFKIRP